MRAYVTAVILWFSVGPLLGNAAESLTRQWEVDGVSRTALIYAPESTKSNLAPVVFGFHGHGGSMQNAARSFHIHEVWPEAIVVYMQGLNTPGKLTDPEGKRSGWQSDVGEQGDRDLKFFDAVLTAIKADYKVDGKRIYATGHSNGGSFTYLLWASRGDVFAAVAPSGSVPGRKSRNLQPKPALHVAGEMDPLVRYTWQKVAMEVIRTRNGCAAEGKPWGKADDLVGTEYPSKNGTPFVSLVYPGGHRFPSAAPELIVRFFQQHTKE